MKIIAAIIAGAPLDPELEAIFTDELNLKTVEYVASTDRHESVSLDTELMRLVIPLAAAEDGGDFTLIRDLVALAPGTRALILMPLAPFRDGTEDIGAMVERVVGG